MGCKSSKTVVMAEPKKQHVVLVKPTKVEIKKVEQEVKTAEAAVIIAEKIPVEAKVTW
jgi:hypothetical protein